MEHRDIAKIIQNFWNVMIKTSLLKILYAEMQWFVWMGKSEYLPLGRFKFSIQDEKNDIKLSMLSDCCRKIAIKDNISVNEVNKFVTSLGNRGNCVLH